MRMDGSRAGRSHPGAAERQTNQPKSRRNREMELLTCSRTVPGGGDADQLRAAAFPREELTDRFFPAPAVALQSHPEQLAGSDALLAVTAPSDAPAVRHIPSWRAPGAAPGAESPGARAQPGGAWGAFRAVCSLSPAGRAWGKLPSQIRPLSGLAAEVSAHFLPGSLRAAPCGFPGQDAKCLGRARSCSLLSC